jgi:calmodulin
MGQPVDKDELREIFSHFDTDSNGVIDRDEFSNLMRALDEKIPEREIELGLGVLDENRNGLIEFDEFANWWNER